MAPAPAASSASSAPSPGASAAASSTQLVRPIIYGSCAYWRGKDAEESKSHEWTVYLRAIDAEEDPGLYIKRVVFQLHPSFNPATRVVEAAPFEVTEQGWGEFEVHIKVFFHGLDDRAAEFSHLLKLYPDAETTGSKAGDNPVETKPVVSERYDEFVFGETSEELCKHLALASKPSKKYGGWKTSRHAKWFGDFQLKQQETQLKEVYERITSELRAASKRRIECEEEIKRLRSEAA